MKQALRILTIIILSATLIGCGSGAQVLGQSRSGKAPTYDYGVFLSVTDNLPQLADYKLVVIDAQYFSKRDIDNFKAVGHQVYSYINIGSLENFRDYYDDYKSLTLGPYENWDEEYWMDVSKSAWQEFITKDLAPSLLKKDIDGFFVDNCDVYYNFPNKKIKDGLTTIMTALVKTGKPVIINGGDAYLDAYCLNGGSCADVITGINQESVFSSIDWDHKTFGTADPETREYFQSYIESYAAEGADIYILEYTTDPDLIKKIKSYCNTNKFHYYISDSLDLSAP